MRLARNSEAPVRFASVRLASSSRVRAKLREPSSRPARSHLMQDFEAPDRNASTPAPGSDRGSAASVGSMPINTRAPAISQPSRERMRNSDSAGEQQKFA